MLVYAQTNNYIVDLIAQVRNFFQSTGIYCNTITSRSTATTVCFLFHICPTFDAFKMWLLFESL